MKHEEKTTSTLTVVAGQGWKCEVEKGGLLLCGIEEMNNAARITYVLQGVPQTLGI